MTNDNSALIAVIDKAICAIGIAIQDQETRKVSMKGMHGKQEERKASKR